MYDRFDYYGVADLNRELVEAEMGRAIYVGMVPKVEIKKGLSYDKLKKGDKVSFVNRQTGKKQVLTVTEKVAPTHEQIKNIFLVGRGGSSYGLHFYKGHEVPKLVRYGGKARGGMRAVPTEVRVEPGSFQIESAESFYGQSFEEACGKSHKKKQGVKWHGIKAVVKKEELESELRRLESTDSPFPEVRARRIEALKAELEEVKKQQQLGPYGEYAPAQEKAMKLQSQGAKSIRIDKKKGGWIISFVSDKKLESVIDFGDRLEESKKQYKIGPYKEQRFAKDEAEVFKPQGVKSIQITQEPGGWFISFSSDKKLFSDRMYWAIINGISGGSQWSRKDISWALNNRGRSSSDSPAAKEIRERYKELSRMEMLKIGYVAPKHQ